jgi:type IV pilus assembly protein PilF
MSTQLKGIANLPVRAIALVTVAAIVALVLEGCSSGPPPLHVANEQQAAAANTQLGIQYMNQGDLNLAKTKLDRALQEAPNSADVHSARAMLFERMNLHDKADDEFRTALKLAPHDPDVINNYAVYLCQNGRTDDGVKHFMEAAHNALYRTPWAAYTNAGVCLRAAKRDDEARADFNAAVQLRPNDPEAAFQLALLDFDHNTLTAARMRIDSYIATYQETPDLLALGVRVARAQGDVVAAQRFSRRLQLDFPGSDQARGLDHNPG